MSSLGTAGFGMAGFGMARLGKARLFFDSVRRDFDVHSGLVYDLVAIYYADKSTRRRE